MLRRRDGPISKVLRLCKKTARRSRDRRDGFVVRRSRARRRICEAVSEARDAAHGGARDVLAGQTEAGELRVREALQPVVALLDVAPFHHARDEIHGEPREREGRGGG